MSDNNNKKIASHLLPLQEKWINMSPKEIRRLFGYYIIILSISLLGLVFSIVYHYDLSKNGFTESQGILAFAFPGGVLGASIYYIRKLYKSCIQGIVVDNSKDTSTEAQLRKIGAKMYFYLRPLISGILAIIVSIAIIAGFFVINNQPSINNEKFFLFIALISFYIGFCNGKIIIKMEQHSNEAIDSVLKEQKDGTQH